MTTATGATIDYSYDGIKRLSGTTVKPEGASTALYTTAYAYKTRSDGKATALVEFRNVKDSSGSIIDGYKYTYDAVGNIIQISEPLSPYNPLVKYVYDSQNQLLSETYYDGEGNTSSNITAVYTYTYDTAGNILTESVDGTVTKTYTYGDSNWNDLLTSINGNTISYDAIGNPTTYYNGTLCSWGDPVTYYMTWSDGRQLTFLDYWGEGQLRINYSYDIDGIRTAKNVEGVQHDYVTQNGKVVRETITQGTTTRILDFIYDESGRPFAMRYSPNGGTTFSTYYYVLNLQGDVVKLITSGGTVIANYEYNAWGELLSVTNSAGTEITTATHVGLLNPLRYRGYYYDTETGFYYLQSRYYDPVTHRFINADSYASTGQGIVGANMFAYCGNNPVVRYDIGGSSWEEVWNWFKDTVDTVLHEGNVIAVSLGIDTAAIGAVFLDMYADENGVYHASFDCWQQYLGYNDLYDFFFDVGTSMARAKFIFVCGTTQYMLWLWKGDYINLGAGIEAGIYTGSEPHWQVDTNVTINMSVMLRYNGSTIATYSADTWWATAFNPAYLNVTASSLSATYVFNFYDSREMFYALYIAHQNNPDWFFDTRNYIAAYSF